jgi:membrane fusion protein, heavy metal efflux system
VKLIVDWSGALMLKFPAKTLNECLLWMGMALLAAGGGCAQSLATPAKTSASPAKTSSPVAEAKLNTIELTEEAVRRLGLVTAAVEERTMLRTRPYGADVVLPTGSTVIVSAPLAGTLKPVHDQSLFHVGQQVTEGRPLLKLLPLLSPERAVLTPAERIRFAEAKNALAQSRIDAEGQWQQTAVQVEAAKIALERAERLLKDKAGTVRMVDEARAQLQLAEKAFAAAATRKQQVESVNLDEEAGTLEAIAIPSPLTGIVRTTQVRPGEMVAAGAPLFEVMNDEVLWVKVPVYVGELDEIDPVPPARLTMLNGRHSESDLFVQPAALPPTAVPLAAAVDLYYELPNPDRKYQPGQKVAAHVALRGAAQQVALPWSAVIHDIYGGQWVYEQTGERQFVRRRLDIGWVDGAWAAVTRGPQPGAKVVAAGAAELAGTEFGFAK